MKKIHITRLATIAGVTGALAIASVAAAADQKAAPEKVTVTVINATPEQIAHFDRMATQTNAGMRAYVDADTKQFRAATQAELNESAARVTAPAAAKRSSAVGSTATTAWPRAAKAAASRPVPAPISSTRAGAAGSRCRMSRCTAAKGIASYCRTSAAASAA